jgi:SAM-dependent methyltransferase
LHEILTCLSPEARVLDLGCGAQGSYRPEDTRALTIRCDVAPRLNQFAYFVQADAGCLPFAPRSFTAVILNHSLEHFADLAAVLGELKRILRPSGYLWVAVPDASTVMDRLYRWVSRGGGHVGQFRNADSLVAIIEDATDLRHAGTRTLFASFAFLNRHNGSRGFGRRMYLFGGGSEGLLRVATLLLRKLDRTFGTRTAIYGWGFCFGPVPHFDPNPWSNVCVRCGTGYGSAWLEASGEVRRAVLGIRWFRCLGCGATNYFTDDRSLPDATGTAAR